MKPFPAEVTAFSTDTKLCTSEVIRQGAESNDTLRYIVTSICRDTKRIEFIKLLNVLKYYVVTT